MSQILFWLASPAVFAASYTPVSLPTALLAEAAAAGYLAYNYHPAWLALAFANLYLYSGIGRENPLRFMHGNSYPGYKEWLSLVYEKDF
jgi:hypothetical protein